MRGAIVVGRYLVEHALAVFDLMGADPAMNDARYLWALVKRNRLEAFTARDLMRTKLPKGRFRKVDDLERPLDLLEAHGYVRRLQVEPRGPKGGRPGSPCFEVNPLALAEEDSGSAGSAGRPAPNEEPPRDEDLGSEPASCEPKDPGSPDQHASAENLSAKPAQPAKPRPSPNGEGSHARTDPPSGSIFERNQGAETMGDRFAAAEDGQMFDPGPSRDDLRRYTQ